MAFLDTKALPRQGVALAREHRADTNKLVLIYCGVIAALSLGSSGLNLLLNNQIGTTGGLDGLGLRSILQTIQEILSYINLLFTPFWSAGFLFAMIRMVRGEGTKWQDLLEGFKRCGRILSSNLYQCMVVISGALFTSMVATLLTALLPLGNLEAMVPQLGITLGELVQIVVWMPLYLAFFVYLSYSFRLGGYLMMERKIGGIAALFLSRYLMRGHKWQIFKLDLQLWWYYLLGVIVSVVGNLDLILGMLGIPMPLGETAMFFLTLGAYCVLLTALYLWKKCDVDAAYVLAFEQIAHPQEEVLAEAE